MYSDPTRLLEPALGAFAKRLQESAAGPVVFDHVTPAAQAFIAALVTESAVSEKNGRRVWILCNDLRVQERIFNEMSVWWNAESLRFFPQLELPSFGDVLPDPEMFAERLAVLHELNDTKQTTAPLALVLLGQSAAEEDVPSPESLRDREFSLAIGDRLDPQEFSEKLDEAGYERVVQVVERGQFAVRGGIIDLFSLQSPLPVRIEL